jgi:hypothetical protein
LRGGIRIEEFRVYSLEGLQLAQQRVELGVGDLRRIVNVVELFVMADAFAERSDPCGG